MTTSLLDLLSLARQPVIELIVQVTLWSLLGIVVYAWCYRRALSNRSVLLSFCLGTLGLTLLILVPLRIWSPQISWTESPANQSQDGILTQASQSIDVSQSVVTLGQEKGKAFEPRSGLALRWKDWSLVSLMLIGTVVVISLARLLLGFLAMEHWRRSSLQIIDPVLCRYRDEIGQAMGVRSVVSLRVSPGLGSPATIGWRRPTILLPSSWTEWDEYECRSVLAHELAHVRNRDYPLWLLVQVAAALHAYHPLVRWLVHRLQGELELAADTLAASHAGGNINYMRSLCRLALRHGSRGAGNVALALLPVHLPLSWRMMMLRSNTIPGRLPGLWSRLLFGCGLGALVVLIAGLRGPAKADEPVVPPPIAVPATAAVTIANESHSDSSVLLQFQVMALQRSALPKLGLTKEELDAVSKSMLVKVIDNSTWSSSKTALEKLRAYVIVSPQLMTTSGRPARFETLTYQQFASNGGKPLQVEQVVTQVRTVEQVEKPVSSEVKPDDDCYLTMISCLPVIQPNGQFRLTLSQEIYSAKAQNALLKQIDVKPTASIASTLDMRFDQTACFIVPNAKSTTKPDEGQVIVSLVHAIRGAKPAVLIPKLPKPTYEIDIRLVQTTPQVAEGFWKSVRQAEGQTAATDRPALRSYSGAKAIDMFTLVQNDAQGSSIYACPKIITDDGTPAQIVLGEKGDEGIKISCEVIQLEAKNELQLTLHEEIARSTGADNVKKAPWKQGVTLALVEDQYCCIGVEESQTTPGSKDEKVFMTLVKVRKVKPNPVAVEKK